MLVMALDKTYNNLMKLGGSPVKYLPSDPHNFIKLLFILVHTPLELYHIT
jgi:hypothetical protein